LNNPPKKCSFLVFSATLHRICCYFSKKKNFLLIFLRQLVYVVVFFAATQYLPVFSSYSFPLICFRPAPFGAGFFFFTHPLFQLDALAPRLFRVEQLVRKTKQILYGQRQQFVVK